CVQGMAFPFTF
nr:immunoglobulin light chain junction region [Macaca mulatta]